LNKNRSPIIDFHTHLFPQKLQQAIDKWFIEHNWEFPFKGGWKERLDFFENHPRVEKFLTFGYAHKPGIARQLNDFYGKLQEHSSKAIALMSAHQDDDDLPGLVREGAALGLAGVKLHHHVQLVRPDDARLYPLYEEVIRQGLFVLMHAGRGPFSNKFVGFETFRKVPELYPELKVVIAHLGAPEADEFIDAALHYENIYLDTSYTFIRTPEMALEAPVRLFKKAAHKIFFASDFPGICHRYDDSVKVIEEIGLNDEALKGVMYGNASKFLGL